MAGAPDKDTETAVLKPQSAWMDGGRPAAAGVAAAGPWRSSATRSDSSKLPTGGSRFDTTIGGRNWREEEREAMPRRDGGRWGEGGGGDVPAGGGRTYTEPHNPAWTDVPAARGGRGRGIEVDSWKPRGEVGGAVAEWRSGVGDAGGAGGGWRGNDRWGGGAAGTARPDSWRAGGTGASRFGPSEPSMDGSRGFGLGRGRGRGAGLIGGIGASERGGVGGAGGAAIRSFGAGGGISGRMRWGASKATRRYSTDQLAKLYKQMLYAGRLKLPAVVERDDPLLFLGNEEFVDVVDQLMGVDPGEMAQAFVDNYALLRSYSHRPVGGGDEPTTATAAAQRQHSALLADGNGVAGAALSLKDEWCYKDPQGVVQGPFSRVDIIEWYEADYFPLELEVRAATAPAEAPFKPLAALLKAWNKPVGPPGFPAGGAAAEAAAKPMVSAFEAAPAPAPEPVAPLAVDLPDADDLLAASLQHLELAPAPPPPVHMPAPTPASQDPVVDPSTLRRAAPGAHLIPQAAPAPAPLGGGLGGPLAQLPLGGPLAQLHAMGSGHLQRHPDLLAAAAGQFQQQHVHPGLMPLPQDAFGGQQHLLAAQHPHALGALPPAPLPPQPQQFAPMPAPRQPAAPELPAWLTQPVPAPLPAPAPQPPAPQPARPMPAPAPAPAAPAGPPRPSLLDIQREQEVEVKRRAKEEQEEAARRQQEAELYEQPSAGLDEFPGDESPALSQPARPKVAPWAAAAPKKPRAKTLKEIQQEEAERAARVAQQEAAVAAAMPASAAIGGWAKAARGNISGGSLTLREIQEEEERQRAIAAVAAAEAEEAQAQVAMAASLKAPALHAASSGGWSSTATAGASSAPSLREVMQRETAAAAPPAPPSASSAAASLAADEDDGGLFWDYGVQQPAARPAVAAPPPPAPARKPAGPVPKAGGWATAVAATTPGVIPAAPAPARAAAPAPAPRAAPAPAQAAPAPAAVRAAQNLDPADAVAIADALNEGGNSALTGSFRGWCQEQMRELTGRPDVTLCEFLVTVESNSELAEYATLYLGHTAAVSRFASEFMKRKLAEATTTAKSSRSRKSKAKASSAATAAPPAAASRAAPAPAVGPPGYAPAPVFPSLGAVPTPAAAKKDADWEKVPKTVGGKKKKKGAKLDGAMLGFGSGTNYSLLEQPE